MENKEKVDKMTVKIESKAVSTSKTDSLKSEPQQQLPTTHKSAGSLVQSLIGKNLSRTKSTSGLTKEFKEMLKTNKAEDDDDDLSLQKSESTQSWLEANLMPVWDHLDEQLETAKTQEQKLSEQPPVQMEKQPQAGKEVVATDGKPPSKVKSKTVVKPPAVKYLLSTFLGILFLAGENSGVGLLALPYSLKLTGYGGVLLMLMISGYCTYCSVILGHCCIIYAERHHDHYPHYPAVGYHAFGRPMLLAVWISLHISTVGICVADITQIAMSLRDLTSITCVCYLMIATACVLMPMTYFGSPKDFWWVAYFSLGSTTLAIVIMDIHFGVSLYYKHSQSRNNTHASVNNSHSYESKALEFFEELSEEQQHDEGSTGLTVKEVTTAVSIIIFAFASIAIFPTLINDLEDKKKNYKVAVITQLTILVLYIPFAMLAYGRYHKDIKGSLLENFATEDRILRQGIPFLMIIYLMTAFIMHFNHTTLEVEHLIRIPMERTWKRFLWRTFFTLFMLFLALTIPHFSDILHIIGGSVSTLLTMVFPPLFYLKITSMTNPSKNWPDRKLTKLQQLMAFQTLIMGIICIAFCTTSNVFTLTGGDSHSDAGNIKCYKLYPPRFYCFNDEPHTQKNLSKHH